MEKVRGSKEAARVVGGRVGHRVGRAPTVTMYSISCRFVGGITSSSISSILVSSSFSDAFIMLPGMEGVHSPGHPLCCHALPQKKIRGWRVILASQVNLTKGVMRSNTKTMDKATDKVTL